MCRALLLLFDTCRILVILIEPDEKLISAWNVIQFHKASRGI